MIVKTFLSPYNYPNANVFVVWSNGNFNNNNVNNSYGVRQYPFITQDLVTA